MDAESIRDFEKTLIERRTQWTHRLDRIQSDRRREGAPLEPDFEEQAVQRENDETLDALDARGRQELEAIESALQRIALNTYGRCVQCGGKISDARLRAQPIAASCATCARDAEAGR